MLLVEGSGVHEVVGATQVEVGACCETEKNCSISSGIHVSSTTKECRAYPSGRRRRRRGRRCRSTTTVVPIARNDTGAEVLSSASNSEIISDLHQTSSNTFVSGRLTAKCWNRLGLKSSPP